jgi:uncharacterized protein (TIGR02757 family)
MESLKDFLEEKFHLYHRPEFIETDPVQVPHRFTNSQDIEIAGFLAASIAWGQRKTILKNANKLMDLMGNSPHDFIMRAGDKHFEAVAGFVHRTFNADDCLFFLASLRNIYQKHNGLSSVFEKSYTIHHNIFGVLQDFRNVFFETEGLARTRKHISDVSKGASAKRLNMFLRWMVRPDDGGVDFGLWTKIPTSALYLPLDLHTGNVARYLNLLKRTQNDWKAVEEITAHLRLFDRNDPVKYDFALFGLGVFEKVGTKLP